MLRFARSFAYGVVSILVRCVCTVLALMLAFSWLHSLLSHPGLVHLRVFASVLGIVLGLLGVYILTRFYNKRSPITRGEFPGWVLTIIGTMLVVCKAGRNTLPLLWILSLSAAVVIACVYLQRFNRRAKRTLLDTAPATESLDEPDPSGYGVFTVEDFVQDPQLIVYGEVLESLQPRDRFGRRLHILRGDPDQQFERPLSKEAKLYRRDGNVRHMTHNPHGGVDRRL